LGPSKCASTGSQIFFSTSSLVLMVHARMGAPNFLCLCDSQISFSRRPFLNPPSPPPRSTVRCSGQLRFLVDGRRLSSLPSFVCSRWNFLTAAQNLHSSLNLPFFLYPVFLQGRAAEMYAAPPMGEGPPCLSPPLSGVLVSQSHETCVFSSFLTLPPHDFLLSVNINLQPFRANCTCRIPFFFFVKNPVKSTLGTNISLFQY